MTKIKSIKEIFNTVDFGEAVQEIVDRTKLQNNRINGMLQLDFVEYDAKDRTVIYEVPVFDWQLNPNDVMHGGLSATIMDTTLGIFANAICYELGGYFAPTVNMTVNYLAPVPANEKIIVKVQLISTNRSIITLNGEIKSKSNDFVSVFGTASYKVLRK
ncbi:MAG: PaaI family thioesterase [Aminipila sp.]